jgi:dTDP-4-dehydrorhamnose reductase
VAMPRVQALVVGADGLIGQALLSELRRLGRKAAGTTRRSQSIDESLIFLDLTADQLPTLPPADVTIICAAVAKFAECRNHYNLAHKVNVKARLALAERARIDGGRVVAMSSSVIFDCMRPKAGADWKPSPRSVYGRLMAEAEAGILASGGTVLRSTKVMTDRAGVPVEWIGALRSGRTVQAFEDHSLCPILLRDVVEAVVAVIEQPDGGIFQVSGDSDISYVDVARHIADRMEIPVDRVLAVRAADHGIPESEVTLFTSLDTSRLTKLTGFRPPEPKTVIDRVFCGLLRGSEVHFES